MQQHFIAAHAARPSTPQPQHNKSYLNAPGASQHCSWPKCASNRVPSAAAGGHASEPCRVAFKALRITRTPHEDVVELHRSFASAPSGTYIPEPRAQRSWHRSSAWSPARCARGMAERDVPLSLNIGQILYMLCRVPLTGLFLTRQNSAQRISTKLTHPPSHPPIGRCRRASKQGCGGGRSAVRPRGRRCRGAIRRGPGSARASRAHP